MSLLAFGINHKTAPVDIRERVAFSAETLESALQDLISQPKVNEAAILSTCNRTELYCELDEAGVDAILTWFRQYHELEPDEVKPYIYTLPDNDAVKHMLRVASGLDSMVLGEPQILGQMKTAFSSATAAGTVGKMLGRLFQHTFSVAKQVRTDTAIGASPVSVAFAAVTLARRIFSDFKNHTVLLVGAGETIELAARHLHENGIGRIIVANRTVEKAHSLALEFNGYGIALGEVASHLAEADIVISSTASQLPVLGKGMVETAIRARKRKPMLMIDIAVPRDIEAEVDSLDDVYLYTVDDMQEIINEGLRSRQEAAKQAEEIIEGQVSHFMGWMRSLDAVSTIRACREQAEDIRDREVQNALKKLQAGGDPEKLLGMLAHNMTNKLMHAPCAQIKQAGFDGRIELIDAARELFDLKKTDET